MASQELSLRTQNLTLAEGMITDFPGVSIPEYSEIPCTVFANLTPYTVGLGESAGVKTLREFTKPTSESVVHYLRQFEEQEIDRVIRVKVEPLLDLAPVIIRCAPVTDLAHSHLSFAGTYPSFVPKPFPQDNESVDEAVASVIAGKHTRYADYYHQRHAIPDRNLGVLAMVLVTGPAIHGTAYSFAHNVRSEHVFDPSLGEDQFGAYHLVNDKYGETGTVDSDDFCSSINFSERLTSLMRSLEDGFGHAVDVEYLVDKEGIIHVVQIRDMSAVHKNNWKRYYSQSAEDIWATPIAERRAIINSVGRFVGHTVKYVVNKPPSLGSGRIQFVKHEDMAQYLEGLNSDTVHSVGQLVILHGDERIRDHLQYAALEDPSIQDLAHTDTGDGITDDMESIDVYSNGDGFIMPK